MTNHLSYRLYQKNRSPDAKRCTCGIGTQNKSPPETCSKCIFTGVVPPYVRGPMVAFELSDTQRSTTLAEFGITDTYPTVSLWHRETADQPPATIQMDPEDVIVDEAGKVWKVLTVKERRELKAGKRDKPEQHKYQLQIDARDLAPWEPLKKFKFRR